MADPALRPQRERKMFQLPVFNLEKIRKSRKRVKGILCDIGLQSCKELVGELKSFDAGDKYFYNTEWSDVCEWDSYRRKKKPLYRTKTFCCSLCKFSTKTIYSFRLHVQRCHEEEQDIETISGCPVCPFTAHPKVINQHFKFFHTMPRKSQLSPSHAIVGSAPTAMSSSDRFSCRKCFYQDSLYYCMKKHILVMHYPSLLSSYFGQRTESELTSCQETGFSPLRFYCKMCNLPAESSDHLLYHILTSDKHRELEVHLKALIYEHGKQGKRNQLAKLASIAPKVKASSQILNVPMLPGTNGQQPMNMVPLPQNITHGVMGPPRPPECSPINSPIMAPNVPRTTATSSGPRLMSPPVPSLNHMRPSLVPPAVMHGAPGCMPPIVRAPCSNQGFLPQGPSASLVQMSPTTPRNSLPPTSPVTSLISSQPSRVTPSALPAATTVATTLIHGGGVGNQQKGPMNISVPTITNNAPKQMPGSLRLPLQHQQQLLPPPSQQQQQGLTLMQTTLNFQNKVGLRAAAPQSLLVSQRLPLTQPVSAVNASKGAMLASQSVLSQLIPTGNKVNGLPTYTLAPVQVALPVHSGNVQNLPTLPVPVQIPQGNPVTQIAQQVPVKPSALPVVPPSLDSSDGSKQAKQWISCPVCNELFPSNVYQVHIEVAHKQQAPPKPTNVVRGLAARAPFLKKIKEKTIKCLACKVLLSEKGLCEHLLHGLNCLFCPAMFSSIKQLLEHTTMEHSPRQKVNSAFMEREYRLYTDDQGEIIFPYFDMNTAAPKEQVGDREINLALVTGSLELIYIKVHLAIGQTICKVTPRFPSKDCPFCLEKFESVHDYELHLKSKHYIMPTIHAILKMPAFKCIYCCGVYTGKTTAKAISVHVQRCRCAPRNNKEMEKIIYPDSSISTLMSVNGGPPKFTMLPAIPHNPPVVLNSQTINPVIQNTLRIESIMRSLESSKSEKESVAAKKRKIDSENDPVSSAVEKPQVILALDPTSVSVRSNEARKEFLNAYFNKKPYLSKKEIEVLASRLWLNKPDVACHFGSKRTRCMKAMQKKQPAVLLGFNMSELKKIKHNLEITEVTID
ncbi:activity-dependent neuroprotector homeobox protein 2-like isoform X1 [Polypterus senegalus]|nr:activity-dependent neuroprotector homeobox protein 2-like isoform X1 [Polypterus senegalus]